MISVRELSTEDLWGVIASALNELADRDECPRLEGYWGHKDSPGTSGIRRTPEDGEWVRRVELVFPGGRWAVVNSHPADAVSYSESIAARACDAHSFVRKALSTPQAPPDRAQDAARTAVRLAGILRVNVGGVCVDPHWSGGRCPAEPLTLTVNDPGGEPASYVFSCRDPMYDDEPFYLLGPCPECRAMVPIVEVGHLADLGGHLANGTSLVPAGNSTYNTEFTEDPRHTSSCRYGGM